MTPNACEAHRVLRCRIREAGADDPDDPGNRAPDAAHVRRFAGYIALYDEDKNRAKAVILWETEEAGVAAEETLAERRRQLSGGLGLTIESEDLYEAPVVELERARVS